MSEVTITGTGPAVVLVHGVGLDRGMWAGVVAALAGRFTCITFDMPGHGTAPPPARPGLQGYVDALEAVVDEYAGGCAAVVGFSMGAMVAAAFAARAPGKIVKLVLMNAVHRRDESQRQAVLKRLEATERDGPAAIAAAAVSRWFNTGFIDANPTLMDRVRATLAGNDPARYLAAYRVFATADGEVADDLPAISCPALAMTAANDVNSTPAMTRAIAGAIPGARALVLDGLAHGAPIEAPERVASALTDFLEDDG